MAWITPYQLGGNTESGSTYCSSGGTCHRVYGMLLLYIHLTNWVGILSQGLRIAPPEAPVTGYMVCCCYIYALRTGWEYWVRVYVSPLRRYPSQGIWYVVVIYTPYQLGGNTESGSTYCSSGGPCHRVYGMLLLYIHLTNWMGILSQGLHIAPPEALLSKAIQVPYRPKQIFLQQDQRTKK